MYTAGFNARFGSIDFFCSYTYQKERSPLQPQITLLNLKQLTILIVWCDLQSSETAQRTTHSWNCAEASRDETEDGGGGEEAEPVALLEDHPPGHGCRGSPHCWTHIHILDLPLTLTDYNHFHNQYYYY